MLCTVYRTRDRGVKLPFPQMPVAGDLRLEKWIDGSNPQGQFHARLQSDTGKTTLLPNLVAAVVTKVTGNGLELRGLEVISRGSGPKTNYEKYPQVWWCLVHTAAMSEDLQEQLQARFMPE